MRNVRVDAKQCVGCRICELVCSFQHTSRFAPEASRIQIGFDDVGGLRIGTSSCNCALSSCVELCPTQALHRTLLGRALRAAARLLPGGRELPG